MSAAQTSGGTDGEPPEGGRRQEIIHAAATLFLESGYRGASMGALAQRVGIAKPTLYHYFTSKSDILYEIHKLYVLPLLERQQGYADRKLPPDDQLRLAIRDLMLSLKEDPGYLRAVIEHGRELGEERDAQFRQISRQHRDLLEKAIIAGIERGIFRDVDPSIGAYAVLGVASWATYWFQPGGSLSAETVAEQFADIILNGFRKV